MLKQNPYMSENKILAFENKFIRRTWHNEEWWFSVVDIVNALTDSKDAGAYWRKLKQRLIEEGSQVVTFCHGLKLEASDGKTYKTDCATAQGIFRIIQSIPSPKAEPFKQWLAKVGHERVQEMADPALSLDRARELWKKHGRSEKWIQQRMTGQETRNKLTDYWKNHEITEAEEFALLTNLIHQEWADVSVQEHKKLKGIKNQKTSSEIEIILVDSGSTDNTVKIAEKEGVIIVSITPEEFSFGYALNIGCEKATGDILLFASAHVYPVYNNWIEKILEPFKIK
jgi:prophage antirepressor-like protein